MPAVITVDASADVSSSVTTVVVSSSVASVVVSFAAVVCAEVSPVSFSMVSEVVVSATGVIPHRLQVTAVQNNVNNTRIENSGNNLFFFIFL